jgi:four helix bundle protein
MNYQKWESSVPQAIKGDILWKVEAYRLALFAADICWQDVTTLIKDGRTRSLADQLYRSLGSVSANIAEGYSRVTMKERTRFYEYALGSGRESRDWYYKGRHLLSEAVITHRLDLMSQIVRLLLVMIPNERTHILKEENVEYNGSGEL